MQPTGVLLEVDYDRCGEAMLYSSCSLFLSVEGVHRHWPGAVKKVGELAFWFVETHNRN